MTAEPRIEDLLASIRRAIEDDTAALQPAPSEPPAERAARLNEELAAAATELKQLRERITRAPAPEPQRAPGIAEAIQGAGLQRPGAAPVRPKNLPAEAAAAKHSAGRADAPHLRTVSSAESLSATATDPALLSERSAQAVQMAFGRLASSAAATISERQVEEMTRELLRGMLKTWLDQNLPSLVERLVREEIERVARGGR